ncbi:hypothetical protein FPZ24_01985 [Sphingomonas panacisoli]|uniref:Uncharacterized protein n=1 Tax=Sphingomonas panacisoli TaxID=1813879 RepID=A0A5B8LF94_9SPHN|nr:hypothetical protein [Sphingomonas panacisoli]QDZ06394.1 hypothetical protein FPZ24_01985 [Sphingomonas panacisoli]
MATANDKIDDFGKLIEQAAASLKLSPKLLRRTRALLGTPGVQGYVPACDMEARSVATEAMVDVLSAAFKAAPLGRRYYWLTFAPDCGNTLDRRPVVNRKKLKRLIDKAVRKLMLDGVAALEFQAITNYPRQGLGRAINFHGHMFAWTDDPNFDPATAQHALNESRAWTSALTVLPVKIDPVVHALADIRRLAAYMLKLPYEAKTLKPSREHPGRNVLVSRLNGYRPELALRLMEGLSQIKLTDLVFGVASGTCMVSAWRRDLRNALDVARRDRKLAKPFNVARHWRRVNDRRRSDNYAPYEFRDDGARPPLLPFIVSTSTRRAWPSLDNMARSRPHKAGRPPSGPTSRHFSPGFIKRWQERGKRVQEALRKVSTASGNHQLDGGI